jgi:hypothetical protein
MRIKILVIFCVLFYRPISAQENYAVAIRIPGNEPVAPGKFQPPWESNLGISKYKSQIIKIELPGCKEELSWKQESKQIKITKPAIIKNEITCVFKVYMD